MIGEALAALAMSASAQLVSTMVGDGWQQVRSRVAGLLGGGEPDEEARQVVRLDRSRDEVVSASGPDADKVRERLVEAWRVRFEDLLVDDPAAEARLRGLLELLGGTGTLGGTGAVNVAAWASDQAQQAVQGQGSQTNTFGAPPPPAQ